MDFSAIEITSKKVRGVNVDFSTIKITSKKVFGKDVIFWSAKLHRKSTWKWRGNSSKFALRRIDIIFTSNRRQFDVEFLLVFFNNVCSLEKNFANFIGSPSCWSLCLIKLQLWALQLYLRRLRHRRFPVKLEI